MSRKETEFHIAVHGIYFRRASPSRDMDQWSKVF
jgi:hypothetical protein